MKDRISNPSSMEPLLFTVDPMSLLLSKNCDNNDIFGFKRGSRYGEYARLRESKLRLKRDFEKILKEEEERFFGGGDQPTTKQSRVSPVKNYQMRFGFKFNPMTNLIPQRSSSSLPQSVPDFSAMIRKENRRPVNSNLLPRRTELTPPPMKSRNASIFHGSASSTRGSISASAGEKSRMMTRKSYANVEDLKKFSTVAASAIHGGGGGGRKSLGGGGGRKSIGGGRTILGFRQIY